jgi:DNA-binding HxlR family transcriptional regulator
VWSVRSYHQYCALARGLDVIGDRWVLLIVRELLLAPRRYGELADGLPGIASNLLADRLRALQASGVVAKTTDDRYELTEWGQGLRDVVEAIGRWAGPLMGSMDGDDAFRGHWIAFPVATLFPNVDPRRPELMIEIRCADESVTVTSTKGRVGVHPGSANAPDLVLTGPPDAIVGLLAQHFDPAAAKEQGVAVTGDIGKLRRLRPTAPGTPPARARES